MQKQSNSQKKHSRRKYLIATVIFFLCIFAGLIYRAMTWEPKPDPASEKIIREIASKQLNEDPNELIDEDFARVKALSIKDTSLIDIMLLEKFTNLQELIIQNVKIAKPTWMKVFTKLGVDMKRFSIDLSPLEKLPNLEMLVIYTPVKNIKPFKNMTNLKELHLVYNVSDLRPIKYLKNLKFHN